MVRKVAMVGLLDGQLLTPRQGVNEVIHLNSYGFVLFSSHGGELFIICHIGFYIKNFKVFYECFAGVYVLCMHLCMYVCMYVVCMPTVNKVQKRLSDTLELELQTLSCHVGAGTKCSSSETEAISPVPQNFKIFFKRSLTQHSLNNHMTEYAELTKILFSKYGKVQYN